MNTKESVASAAIAALIVVTRNMSVCCIQVQTGGQEGAKAAPTFAKDVCELSTFSRVVFIGTYLSSLPCRYIRTHTLHKMLPQLD